nr:unnamed protein product [Digitaria exilis]
MQLSDQPSSGGAAAEAEAFVPRVGGPQGLRRRSGEASIDSSPRSGRASDGRRSTFSEDVGHAAAETYLVTSLAFTLLGYLGNAWLLGYVFTCFLIFQGRLSVDIAAYCAPSICSLTHAWLHKRLDLYIPRDHSKSSPVVAFVTGGAWIIGYKAWGALLGRRLAERGIIVACIDYRNFPQGTISDMVSDASEGISFVCNNAVSFGGDPNR